MMDFGLQGLLDRIERDFGKRWARALTALIGVAIVAGCLTIVGNLISEFSMWLSGITSESTIWGKLFVVGKYVVSISFLILLANSFASVIAIKALTKQAMLVTVEADENSRILTNQMDRVDVVQHDINAMLDKIEEIVARLAKVSPPEIAAELNELLQNIEDNRR